MKPLPIDGNRYNWHIGDGVGAPRRSPYETLICTVYSHAIFEMRRYKAGTRLFEDAAVFLLRDPYGILSDDAQKKLSGEIWEKRDKYRADLENDLVKEGEKIES